MEQRFSPSVSGVSTKLQATSDFSFWMNYHFNLKLFNESVIRAVRQVTRRDAVVARCTAVDADAQGGCETNKINGIVIHSFSLP